jgi:hypothetical protein
VMMRRRLARKEKPLIRRDKRRKRKSRRKRTVRGKKQRGRSRKRIRSVRRMRIARRRKLMMPPGGSSLRQMRRGRMMRLSKQDLQRRKGRTI